jgi:hypothetical protein
VLLTNAVIWMHVVVCFEKQKPEAVLTFEGEQINGVAAIVEKLLVGFFFV